MATNSDNGSVRRKPSPLAGLTAWFRQRPLISILLGLLVVLLIYLQLVEPMLDDAANLAQETESVRQLIAAQEALVSRERQDLSATARRIQTLSQRAGKKDKPSVPGSGQDQFMAELRKLAQETGLKLESLAPAGGGKEGDLRRLATYVVAQGKADAIWGFITRAGQLETTTYLVYLQLSRPSGGGSEDLQLKARLARLLAE